MELDDLRFNDRDVRRILELAVKQEKGRLKGIDTSYGSAATYDDLLRVTAERGLPQEVVEYIVENQDYLRKNRIYELAKENVQTFVGGVIGSFIIGVGIKYLGNGQLTNPLIAGVGSTVIVDILEYNASKKHDLAATLRNDIGTITGQTLGWTLASII